MSKVPGAPRVMKALQTARQAIRASLKEINQQAAKQLGKGNYAGAEALVEVARGVDAFTNELDGLIERWKNLRSVGGSKAEQTALWEYYQPILRALQRLGGVAATEALLPEVERELDGHFRSGDHDLMARGQPRWKVMVRRAKKHMVQEGFIEDTKGTWTLTPAGRRTPPG